MWTKANSLSMVSLSPSAPCSDDDDETFSATTPDFAFAVVSGLVPPLELFDVITPDPIFSVEIHPEIFRPPISFT